MPRVPSYDSLQVQANVLPQARLTNTPVQDFAGQQSQQMARGLMQAGDAAGRVALDMQQQANEVRISEALNAVKEEQLRLTFDQETGYQGLKGKAAIERPDGKSLWDEYGEQLQRKVSDIEGTLGNDAQKAAFQQATGSMVTEFRGRAMQHVLSEDRTYRASVWEGVQATGINEIRLAYGDPKAVESATRRIQAAVYADAQLRGMSAEWVEAKTRDLLSSAHKSVAASLLDEGKVDTARSYVNQYKEAISGEDLLVIHKALQTQLEAGIVHAAGSAASTLHGQTFDPSDLGQLTFAIKQVESAGQRHGKDGQLLTSPKGALGEMQVMPETAQNPGFGIKPAKDNSPEELARVGREYIPAMIKHYGGDVEKAIAAYNAGPGAVDDAVAKAKKEGGHWLAYLPKETREYLPKVQAQLAQARTRMKATKQDYVAAAEAEAIRLGGNATTVNKAIREAEHRFEVDKQAATQRADDALYDVMQALSQNGGNYDGLPASLKQALPADKLDNALKFAETLRKVGKVPNDAATWAEVMSMSPEQLKNYTPKTFFNAFAGKLDEAHLEKGYALINAASGSKDAQHLEVMSVADRMKQTAQRAGYLPLKGSPSKDQLEQYGRFATTVEQRLMQLETVGLGGKRKATGAELQQVIDSVMLDTVRTPGWFGGDEVPASMLDPTKASKAYVNVGAEEIRIASIPDSHRAAITAALQQRKLPVTEQAIATYWVRAGKPK